ncbi:MAG: hypothetical protein GY774_34285 [Planctomycetes bacterium]|nr:hypothetical protein [Planctomycetota bacterium]
MLASKFYILMTSSLVSLGRFDKNQERKFTMKHVLLAGFCLMLPAACGCQSNEDPESSSLSLFSDDLVGAAEATYVARLRAVKGGIPDLTNEIYSTYWADGIKALNPIKVYTHRINIVVVQRISDGTEEGKYIVIPISSYLPMTGDDGFVFNPEPLNGNTYNMSWVFDFKRTISM